MGDRVYQVPDWTGNASATYTIRLGGESSVVTSQCNSAMPRVRPGYSLLDARVAYVFGAYEVAVAGKNLSDVKADLADNRSLAAETLGRPRPVVNQPRTPGIERRASF